MEKFSLLIIGATVLGCGAAVRHAGRVKILEEGIVPGGDFVMSYKYRNVDESLISDKSARLFEDLKKRNLISEEGNIHLLPMSGILASYINNDNISVSFSSFVTNIAPKASGFEVEFCSENGIERIFAEKILDTTPLGCMHDMAGNFRIRKSLCAMLNGRGGSASDEVSFHPGRFESENILQVKLEFDDTWQTARRKMAECWDGIYESLPETKLAAVASEFCYDFDAPVRCEISENRIWQPGVSYNDALFSFGEGGI